MNLQKKSIEFKSRLSFTVNIEFFLNYWRGFFYEKEKS
ncbi:hypothetical protein LEP1GSC008_1652 [Leptospira kirschneri serovar Bulgarica str. Nikolaevo]|uniref:Uncharacterized protein n=1 Tax=Leptospira kirschneri serovar Bulgarica str. Nikolaevo TaxID=1240687 RepID=M6FGR5_9LEPT|nr:hypothetical protein LEP1GSC008_1652 [Leptospira kirschneri serovar Bulgarica str. Nikolaevo]